MFWDTGDCGVHVRQIPKPIIEADAALHRLLKQLAFSRHLNPTNIGQAKSACLSGKPVHFRYIPFPDPDDFISKLESLRLPSSAREHPFGLLVEEKIHGTISTVLALKERNQHRFDELMHLNNWLPPEELASAELPSIPYAPSKHAGSARRALDIVQVLKKALDERDLGGWSITLDPIMSARVLVDSSRKELRVAPNSLFSHNDLSRLVVHEIDVHAQRSANGSHQGLNCFATGLQGSMKTEEGLALLAEEHTGTISPSTLHRQQHVISAIHMARELGISELYTQLRQNCSASLAWNIALRVKRGLKDPEQPGVYAKDSVYLVGWFELRKWLMNGGSLISLYVGKVGIEHPIDKWIEAGLLSRQSVPQCWQGFGVEKLRSLAS